MAWLPPDLALSGGQVARTSRRGLSKCEGTWRMIALTRDFHIVASRVPTRLSAVFVSIRYIAEAWYVGALSGLLSRHYNFVLFRFRQPSPITGAPRILT
jgi:hypothetical protein